MRNRIYVICLRLCAVVATVLYAAAAPADASLWSDIGQARAVSVDGVAMRARVARLEFEQLQVMLQATPLERAAVPGRELTLPLPDGSMRQFRVKESPIMAPELAAKFPQFKTYAGHALDDSATSVRFDTTHKGFHAIIFTTEGTVYIDPEHHPAQAAAASGRYKIYFKRQARTREARIQQRQCLFEERAATASRARELTATVASLVTRSAALTTGPELREYRLAVAATGEYTAFHGGSVADGMAAIVTAMNRVNGIYETEVAVRMILVANNDLIVYTNSGTDPYSNNNGSAMLGQNQSNLDSVIQSANYDIGHVFSTGGGIAALGVPCFNPQKAEGVTGLSSPVGDPFFIDFVAHEMGHQYGGEHTFNGTAGSCSGSNRNGPTAYEPGSGSTVMAYAGICGAQDIQSHSDDHFHSASFDQITAYTQLSTGNNCPVVTATGNDAPSVDAGQGGFTIPIDTPFELTGSAADANGDDLEYRWEEFDLGPAGAPGSATSNAPLFRSFTAEPDPTRTFPRASDLLNNTQTIGELLPSYTRDLSFRLTALDNRSGGGGVNYASIAFSVTTAAGPFLVQQPNTAVTWTANEQRTVTWDVAGTDTAPVSCSNVDISLSSDGGAVFSTLLAGDTPNDGSEDILVPNVETAQARIKVACSNNVFFDLSDSDFTINALVAPDFALQASPVIASICVASDADYQVELTSLLGFSDPVTLTISGLPAGAGAAFAPNPVIPTASSTLSISNTHNLAAGTYPLTIEGDGGGKQHSDDVDLEVVQLSPATPVISVPAPGMVGAALSPILSWNAVGGAGAYVVEIATDAAFTNIVYSAAEADESHTVGTPLDPSTGYFWRIIAQNVCGDSDAANGSFVTLSAQLFCSSPGAAIPDNSSIGIIGDVVVGGAGTIIDLNVPMQVTHTWIGDLTATLNHDASGESVQLLNRPGVPPQPGCNGDNVDVVLDDEGTSPAADACGPGVPAMSGNLTPVGALSDFDGHDGDGTWTLQIADRQNGDTGTLDTWCVAMIFDVTFGDGDDDGIVDVLDNCPLEANSTQDDFDADGTGDVCDVDIDDDGIANDWEIMFGLDPFDPIDAELDPDRDGLTNLDEFLNGSDPTLNDTAITQIPILPPWALVALAAALGGMGLLAKRRASPRR